MSADNTRLLRVTLDITVSDLPTEKRLELAEGICFDEESPAEAEAEMPRIAHLQAHEVADVLRGLTQEDLQSELWAGSEMYANFDSVKAISAVWES